MSTQDNFNRAAEALRRAVDAREGDSNDDEIEALWDAVEELADIAAVPMPLPKVERTIKVTLTGRLSDDDLRTVGQAVNIAVANLRATGVHQPIEQYQVDWGQ